MRYVTTPVATQLTGLSTDKLREWTSRRAIIPADVRPKRKGSPAKFTWQTVLILRLAVVLRDHFNLELQAHKPFFDQLRQRLHKRSFISLWGQRLALRPSGWDLMEESAPLPQGDAIILELDPHLHVLRVGFALPDAAAARGQLDLFALPKVRHAEQASSIAEDCGVDHRRLA